jgi:predicted nuclease of predicted toxin-antitoxin system
MKFLVDAQLPVRLARVLQSAGCDTIHTKDLPQQNATPDSEINLLSIQESRIVVTKDRDFLDSFMINQQPHKLLLLTTGNINNNQLIDLFVNNLSQLEELFQQHSLIEMNRDTIVVHQ